MTTIKEFFTKLFNRASSPDGVAPAGFAPNEEFESKRTTKLGMVFVIIMVITGIWQGQSLFTAINATITPPKSLSQCFFRLVSESGESIPINYDDSGYYSRYSYQNIMATDFASYGYSRGIESACVYSDIENTYHIKELYDSITPALQGRNAKITERELLQNQLSNLRYSSSGVRDSYNTSLLEAANNTASPVYSSSSISIVLRTKEDQMQALQSQIDAADNEIKAVSQKIKGVVLAKIADLRHVADDFNSELRWLELKRFLVSIILLAPLAFFTLRKYFRVKNERSEYAIIWAAVALISTILSVQLLLVFAYKILPRHLIQAFVAFFAQIFSQFAFLLVVFQWFALILVPLFFGFLVYKIQKRYYNKEAVMMRALKDNKCPQCSMHIKDQMVFCPSCSYALRKACGTCKHASISYARFCEECGTPFQKAE